MNNYIIQKIRDSRKYGRLWKAYRILEGQPSLADTRFEGSTYHSVKAAAAAWAAAAPSCSTWPTRLNDRA